MSTRADLVRRYSGVGDRPQVRGPYRGTFDRNPDREAEVETLRAETGMPEPFVRRQHENLVVERKIRQYEQLRETSPDLHGFLADPSNASVAHDDIESLSGLEWVFKSFRQSHRDMWSTIQTAQEFTGPIRQGDRDRAEAMQAQGQSDFGAEGWLERVVVETGRVLPTMEHALVEGSKRGLAAGMGTATMTALAGQAGPQAALPEELVTVPGAFGIGYTVGTASGVFDAVFDLEAGLAYQEFLTLKDESGEYALTEQQAKAASEMVGTVNASLESFGLGYVVSKIPGLRRIFPGGRAVVREALQNPTFRRALVSGASAYAGAMGTEITTEVLQEASTVMGGEIAAHLADGDYQGLSRDEMAARIGEVAIRTAQGMTLLAGVGPSVQFVQDARRVRNSRRNQDVIRALGESAEASKLRERLPQRFRDYVARLRESGDIDTVRIPVDRFDEYFQSQGLDPEAVAREVTGSDTAYNLAHASGVDIEISIEDYATRLAGTEHHQGIAMDMRFRADEMTAREAEAWQSQADALTKSLAEQLEGQPTNQSIYDDVVGQLVATGMEQGAAEQNATVMAAFFETMGQRAGVDPVELYQRYGLRIDRELPAVLRDIGRIDETIDPLLDRLRTGRVPTDREIYGASLTDFLREKGGVRDQGGELAARDIQRAIRGLVKPQGLTFDAAAELAQEAGYLTDANEQALLDAIEREAGGEGVFLPQGNQALLDLRTALEDLDAYLQNEGLDLSQATNEQVRELLQGTTFEQQAAPETTALSDADIEAEYFAHIDNDIDGLIAEYEQLEGTAGGKILNTDLARELSPHYRADRTRSQAVHEPASALVREMYRRRLLEEPANGERPGVLFTAGGTGAGKTSGLRAAGIEEASRQIVYDTNLGTFDSAKQKIDQALEAGKDVQIVYTYREPVEALANGVIPRAVRMAERLGSGRTVPIDVHVQTHVGSREVIGQLIEAYGNRVDFTIIDNSHGRGGAREVELSDLPELDYNQVSEKTHEELQRQKGQIPEAIYQAIAASQTEEALVERRNGQADRRRAEQPLDSLYATHNLTEANIEHARRMGGLPVPSLAITTVGAGFDNFGEISLIADPSLIDPQENPYSSVYNADIYSPRYPTIHYKVNRKALDKFYRTVGDRFRELNSWASGNIDESEIRRNGLRPLLESTELQFYWLNESGRKLTPVMRERPSLDEYGLTEADAEKWGNPHFVDAQQMMRDPEFQALVRARLSERNKSKYDAEVAQQLDEMLDDGDGLMNMSFKAARRIGSWWEWKPEAVDEIATREKVRKKMGPRLTKEYQQWVKNNFGDLIDGDYIVTETRGGNLKKAPHTLDNVVNIMMRNLRGGEGFNYGVGNVRSKVARKFSSLSAIQKKREKIESKKAFTAAKDELQDRFVSLLETLKPYYRYEANAFGYLDDASMAVGEYASSARRYALPSSAFRDVPGYIMEEVDSFLDELRDLPTEYFEAKITRAVEISEFSGAVVPKGTGKKTVDYLKSQGLQVRTYDPKVEGARSEAVGKFKRLLFQSFDETRRGSIRFGADRQFRINLLKDADLSTFLHESGHFYLEVLGDMAEAADAPTQIVQDYASILNWLGVETRQSIETKHHEQFARGFEAYLMEGKAPSVELQTAFARFKAWLTQIYRRLSRLNVTLSDEVRGVFDRLLATDDAIDAASESQNYVPLFTNAEAAGMSQQQFEAYRGTVQQARIDAEEDLTQKLMAVMTREQRKWWREETAKMRDDVTGEVHGMRVYRALSFLQQGRNPDGSEIEGATPVKLSKQILMDEFGYPQEFLNRLPGAGKTTVYAVDGGVHPDVVAGLFGYDDGHALIQDLVNARPMRTLIEAETQSRMREKYPDPLTDGTIAEKAMNAVHSGKRAELLAAELRALRRKQREVRPFVRAAEREAATARRESREANRAQMPDRDDLKLIRAAAERIIGQRRIRNISPHTFRVAEAKAARKAFEAAGKGDFQTAYFEKRKQLLNHELYRAATEAQEQSEKIREYFKRFGKTRVRERIGKAGGGLLEQIDAVLEDISLKRVSGKRMDRIGKVLGLIESGELLADQATIRLLEQQSVKNWRELTFDEFVGMRDIVKQLEHQAKAAYEAIVNGEKRQIDADATEIATAMRSYHKVVETGFGEPTSGERRKSVGRNLLSSWLRAGNIARILDGSDFGPMTRRVITTIRKAYAERLIPMLVKSSEDTSAIYQKHYESRELSKFGDKSFHRGLSKSDVLSIALNWGNEENRKALLSGRVENPDGSFSPAFTEAQVQAALAKLDARDWAFVQEMWDYLDSYWSQLSDSQRRRRGISPKKVEAAAFSIATSDGQTVNVKGGYYPLKYDPRYAERIKQAEIDDYYKKIQAGGFASVSTRAGATHERVGSGGKIVKLGLNVIDRHLNEIIRDIAIGDEVNYAHRMLTHRKVIAAARETGNAEMLDSLEIWLKDAAVGEVVANDTIERWIGWIRTGFVKAKLAFNLVTTLLQVTGLPQTVGVIGARSVSHGLGRYLTNPVRMHKEVMSRSKFMQTRYETGSWNKDVADTRAFLKAQFGYLPTASSRALDAIGAAYFWPIQRVQMLVDEVTWLSGYWKGVEEKGLSETDAVTYADSIVEQAQTSGFFSDRSNLERGTLGNSRQSQFIRIWTVLVGYMLAKANNLYEKGHRFAMKPSLSTAVSLASFVLYAYIIEAMIEGLIRGDMPDDDDEQPYAWWLAKRSADNLFAGVPFAREVTSAKYGGGNTPVGSLGHDIFNAMVQSGQGEVDPAMLKAISNVAGTVGHLPSTQFNRAIDAYWAENVEGEDMQVYEYFTGPRE